MTETAVVGIIGILAGVIGTLGGVYAGHLLESGRADRDRRRDAYRDFGAAVMESLAMVSDIQETSRLGLGVNGPALRDDFAHEYFRALMTVKLSARAKTYALVTIVGDRYATLMDAALPDPLVDTTELDKAVMDALGEFTVAATIELGPFWRRWWHNLRHLS